MFNGRTRETSQAAWGRLPPITQNEETGMEINLHKRSTTNVITAPTARVCRMSSEHTNPPSAKFITHVGVGSMAPRTRAPQPIYAFISPLTKASRSAFTFSGSVIAIP
jgi:hypothetical protein